VLARADTRGDAWWRKLERLTKIALKAAMRKLKKNYDARIRLYLCFTGVRISFAIELTVLMKV
jgi:hypothetical protein